MAVRKAYRYIGGEYEFLQGVPRKDLSADEFEALSPEQQSLLEANLKTAAPLYEAVKDAGDAEVAKARTGRQRGAQGQEEPS